MMRVSRTIAAIAVATLAGWPVGIAAGQSGAVDGPAAEDAEGDGEAAEESPVDAPSETDDQDEGDAGSSDQASTDDAFEVTERGTGGDTSGLVTEGDRADRAGGGPAAAEGTAGAVSDAEVLNVDQGALVEPLPDRPSTGIFGRVIDDQLGEPVFEEIPVFISGVGRRTFTTIDGFFSFRVPPGTYTLRATLPQYENARVEGVEVKRGELTELVIRLQPEAGGGDIEIEVVARSGTVARQLQERRDAASVTDGFSAEQIQESGDSDAGDASRRVVGASVVDGRYLVVRGLGGRYVNTLVNRSPFPSLDPDNASVQLDLFPTGIIDSISVVKTFTADLPAAFAGGTMLIDTRHYPQEFVVGAGVSLGVNSETTFREVPSYPGGSLDWTGFDDGTRELPGALDGVRLPGQDANNYEELSNSFPNNWEFQNRTALPQLGLSLNIGDTVLVGDRLLGYLVSFGYNYDEQRLDSIVRPVQGRDGETIGAGRFDRESNEQTISWGALGTTTLELAPGHDLRYTSIFTKSSSDYTAEQTGILSFGESFNQRSLRYQWTERQVWWNQLHGGHSVVPSDDVHVDWRLWVIKSDSVTPDLRDVAFIDNDEGEFFWRGQQPSDGRRLFFDLDQLGVGGSADLAFQITDDWSVGLGAFADGFDREFLFRRFTLVGLATPMLPPEEIFTEDNLGVLYRLTEDTLLNDSYDGTQRLYAAYAQVDGQLLDWLRANAGVRVESFRQTVQPVAPFPSDVATGVTARSNVDPLPTVNLIAEVAKDMFVRAGYSITLARPLLRELAPFTFPDFERQATVSGNADLRRTRIQNVDVRWEWFPGATEVLAVSGFIKLFEDPIERVITGAGRNNRFTFQNISEADNFGLELEARVDLKRFTDILSGVNVGSNLTLVRSRVSLTPEEQAQATNAERPLRGQSPFVVNANVGFEPDYLPIAMYLYYNVFGERISEVGNAGLDDVYQEPFHQLDFTFRWRPTDQLTVGVKVQNLLNETQIYRQGQVNTLVFQPGVDGSISVQYQTN